MRLFLLPVSSRRALIYSKKLNVTISDKQNLLDKGTARAAALWAGWEKKDSGWQKRLVDLGNTALKRIPFEEWGLKSIPPLSKRREDSELQKGGRVEVVFPKSLIPENKVPEVLTNIGTARQAFHRQRMLYCLVGMPITVPFALVPVIPNIPFFYLAFRAWSHWRALSGSRHIMFLLDQKLIDATPSTTLDNLYARTAGSTTNNAIAPSPTFTAPEGPDADAKEDLVIDQGKADGIAKAFDMPELSTEFERAIWQVETANSAKERKEAEHGTASTTNDEKKDAAQK